MIGNPMTPDRISIACPHCDVVMKIRDEYAGKSIRCKNCRDVFQVPVYCERICPGCRETLRFRSIYLNYTVACRKCQTQFWLDPIDRRAAARRVISLGSSSEFSAIDEKFGPRPIPDSVPSPISPAPVAGGTNEPRRLRDDAIADRSTMDRQLADARAALESRDRELRELQDRIAAAADERTMLARPRDQSQALAPADSDATLLDAEMLTMPMPDVDPSARAIVSAPAINQAEWQAKLATIQRCFEEDRDALSAVADRERAMLQGQIDQAKARYDSLHDESRSIHAENVALRAEIARRQDYVHELRQRLSDQEGEQDEVIRGLQADQARIRAELEQAQRSLADRQAEADAAREAFREADEVRTQLQQRIHDREADAAASARAIDDLHRQVDALSARLEAADHDRKSLIERQRAEMEERSRVQEEARRTLEAKSAEHDGLVRQVQELETNRSQLEMARTKIQEAEEARLALTREAEQLRRRITGLETDRLSLTKMGETLRGQLDALKAKRAESAAPAVAIPAPEVWKVRGRLWETEREGQAVELEDLRQRLAAIEVERAALLSDRDAQRRRSETLASEKTVWQADRLALQKRIQEAEAEVGRLQQAEAARRNGDNHEDSQPKTTLAESERERLEQELKQAEEIIRQLRVEKNRTVEVASRPNDAEDSFGRFLPDDSL